MSDEQRSDLAWLRRRLSKPTDEEMEPEGEEATAKFRKLMAKGVGFEKAASAVWGVAHRREKFAKGFSVDSI